MVLRQILAVVDFSVPGIHAAWRAARLAWSHGAELRLITLVEPLDSHPASRFGPGAPPVRAHADLSFLVEEIGAALGVRTAVSVGAGTDAQEALHRAARAADLVVVPAEAAVPGLRGRLQGAWAERLLRAAGVPVLICRRPSGVPYRHALVAFDPAEQRTAPALLHMARWFCEEHEISACHVMSTDTERHLHAADLPLPAVQAWLETARVRAQVAVSEQLAHAGLPRARGVVVHGEPVSRLALEQARTEASLLVVGKPRRAWWVDLLRPGLARRLAQRVRCDVLWVPSPGRSAPVARQRLAPVRPALR